MVTDALVFLRLWDVKMKKLTEKEKFEAGKAQMYQYLDSQYLAWHRNGETLTKGVLQTFDNRPIKIKNNTTPAALIFNLTPETQGCLRDLYNDSNMLHYSLHSLDIDEIIKVTGEAYELISVLRHNLIKRSRLSERDEFHEWAFPSGQREKMMLMGFPIEKD